MPLRATEFGPCWAIAGTQAIGVADDGMSAPPLPRSLEQLKALLATAAALPQPPPMILANPDRVTVDGEGGLIPM